MTHHPTQFMVRTLIIFFITLVAATRVESLQPGALNSPPASEKAGSVGHGVNDQNPCIFDNNRAFTYLHIGYVPYFNLSNRAPTFATTDECLDVCTNDCSCSAVVFDVPHDACYIYHDYLVVQTIPFVTVGSRDTISAYIKVERGSYSAAPPRRSCFMNSLSLTPLVLLLVVLLQIRGFVVS